jgi:DDE superfamily endonuclease
MSAAHRINVGEIFIPVNNAIEADHGRLKARLRPMRGLKRLASARIISAGHAFVQNLRRGHYAMTADCPSVIGCASRSTSLRYPSNRSQVPAREQLAHSSRNNATAPAHPGADAHPRRLSSAPSGQLAA